VVSENPALACPLCRAADPIRLDVGSLLFPTDSYAPEFHRFTNMLCRDCGVVFSHPRPAQADLVAYYNGAYRSHDRGLRLDGRVIEPPLQADRLDTSMARFANFHQALRRAHAKPPGVADTVVDFGAYQGMFLYAAKTLWGCRGIAIDYNRQGIAFAQGFLGLPDSRVTTDIAAERFADKVGFATLVHALEHLPDPRMFLDHLRAEVIRDDGWLYIEVPNLFGAPVNDPTHFFTYSGDSLRWLVEASGFEVVTLFTSGHPETDGFLCRNDEENLICLARPAAPRAIAPPRPDAAALAADLSRHWSRHARQGVSRQIRLAAREAARALLYAAFVLVLEPLAPGLAARLRRRRHGLSAR